MEPERGAGRRVCTLRTPGTCGAGQLSAGPAGGHGRGRLLSAPHRGKQAPGPHRSWGGMRSSPAARRAPLGSRADPDVLTVCSQDGQPGTYILTLCCGYAHACGVARFKITGPGSWGLGTTPPQEAGIRPRKEQRDQRSSPTAGSAGSHSGANWTPTPGLCLPPQDSPFLPMRTLLAALFCSHLSVAGSGSQLRPKPNWVQGLLPPVCAPNSFCKRWVCVAFPTPSDAAACMFCCEHSRACLCG